METAYRAFSNVEAGSGRAGQKKEETVSTALEMEKKKTPKMMTSSNAEKKNVLSAEVGSMEIQIREKTAGALEQAEALEVYDLGQDAAVEAALLEKLEEGESWPAMWPLILVSLTARARRSSRMAMSMWRSAALKLPGNTMML